MAADVVLVLGTPSGDQTLGAALGKLRRFKLPMGTRRYVVTAEAAFFLEEDLATPQVKTDASDSTASARHKYAAGTYTFYPVGTGHGLNALATDRYIYFVGSANDQPFWATAYAERGTD